MSAWIAKSKILILYSVLRRKKRPWNKSSFRILPYSTKVGTKSCNLYTRRHVSRAVILFFIAGVEYTLRPSTIFVAKIYTVTKWPNITYLVLLFFDTSKDMFFPSKTQTFPITKLVYQHIKFRPRIIRLFPTFFSKFRLILRRYDFFLLSSTFFTKKILNKICLSFY